MTFLIYTLGCKQNHYESTFLHEKLKGAGYKISKDDPKYIIVHTCGVTNRAEYKSRDQVKRMKRKYPKAKVIAIGCSAEYHREKYYEIGADIVLDNNEKFILENYNIAGLSGNYLNENSLSVHDYDTQTRAFLSIQNGCDLNCAYCIITKLRHESHSKSIENIHKEIKNLIDSGKKEIVITGINIALWGKEWKKDLSYLLGEIQQYKNIRFRLSSLNVNNINENIIFYITENNNVMPHIHISLQSGSNKILKLHRRYYTKERFIEITNKIKSKNKFVNIGIDIIAGLPGEEETDFQETISTLKSAKVDYMHIFPYSKRDGTDAVNFPQVNGNEIIRRK
ncbi:MiaB/RimO family radical SAM methylthiotransferase, partial [bacterium]|nr:MiaB/RimO family radical SAM methylthiotransferase [bacterium]